MELERSLDKFKEKGLGVVAISYDRQELLQHFAERMGGFNYPLLADPESKIIRDFGIFNTNVPEDHEWYGMCFPGTYIVDANGVVQSKYFEEMHRQRYTADSILVKEYGAEGVKSKRYKSDHLFLTVSAAQHTVRPGNIVTLVFEVVLPEKMHVYAPGVEGYRPLVIEVVEDPYLKAQPTVFPEAKTLHLEAIEETVPVYEGEVRVLQDVTISPRLREESFTIPVNFSYQACDDQICYPPWKFQVEVELDIEQHDRERAPEHLRKKGEK